MIDEYRRIANLKNKKIRYRINSKWTKNTKDAYTNSVQTFLKSIAGKYGIQKGGNILLDGITNKINNKVLEKQFRYVEKRFPQYYIDSEKDRELGKSVYSGLVSEIFSFVHHPLSKDDLQKVIKKSTDNTLLYLNYNQSKKGETLEHILLPHIYDSVVHSL